MTPNLFVERQPPYVREALKESLKLCRADENRSEVTSYSLQCVWNVFFKHSIV